MFPAANQPDILSANEKDEFHLSQLRLDINDVFKSVLGFWQLTQEHAHTLNSNRISIMLLNLFTLGLQLWLECKLWEKSTPTLH
jgi:hypothetical protein